MSLRLKKFKISEQKLKCNICGQRIPNYIQDQYEHVNKFHLQDLEQYGILPEEINKFKEGFKWNQSTTNPPL